MQKIFSLLLVVSIGSLTLFSAGGEKGVFSCTFCGKGFGQDSHRKRHELIHEKTYPFECILCGHGIRQKGNMKTHVGTHTNDELCPWGCGYSFNNSPIHNRLSAHQGLFGQEDHANKVKTAVQANQDCLWISKLPKPKKKGSRKRKRVSNNRSERKRCRFVNVLQYDLDRFEIITEKDHTSETSSQSSGAQLSSNAQQSLKPVGSIEIEDLLERLLPDPLARGSVCFYLDLVDSH